MSDPGPHGFLLGKAEFGGSGDGQWGEAAAVTEESEEARLLAWRPGGCRDTKEMESGVQVTGWWWRRALLPPSQPLPT